MNEHQVMAGVAIVAVVAMALWMSLRGLKLVEALEARLSVVEAELAASREALRQAAGAAEAAERGIEELRHRLADIGEQIEQLRLRDEESGSYSHAIRLARRGASAEQLVRDCGLNRGEAELVISLHGRGAGD